ncbi:unnamed protein product, partial [Meganyctiphanes norvegica]
MGGKTQPKLNPTPPLEQLNQNGLYKTSVSPRTQYVAMGGRACHCPGCRIKFNSTRNLPLILGCGHNLCANCVDIIDRQIRICCPSCNLNFDYSRTSKPPIDFAFLRHLLVNENEIPTIPPTDKSGNGSTSASPILPAEPETQDVREKVIALHPT